jgi:hypothetical protein
MEPTWRAKRLLRLHHMLMLPVRILTAHAAQRGIKPRTFDIGTAYLNGVLKTKVYVRPPPGGYAPEGFIWELQKALYGLKEAGRVWRKDLKDKMLKVGYVCSKKEPCLFFKGKGEKQELCLVHVDDIFALNGWESLLKGLRKFYKVKDNGWVKDFLGLQFTLRHDGEIFMHQRRFTSALLDKYHYKAGKSSSKPTPGLTSEPTKGRKLPTELKNENFNEIVGALLWLSRQTRPDIAHAVSKMGQRVQEPGVTGWAMASRLMRYLLGTQQKGISFTRGNSGPPYNYSDSDHAGDLRDRKSQNGWLASLLGRGTNLMVIKEAAHSGYLIYRG